MIVNACLMQIPNSNDRSQCKMILTKDNQKLKS